MCIKITNPHTKSNSMKNPSRKIRSRTRKPKFLSLLRLDSSPANPQLAGKMTHQLNLFPLHPENNPIEEKDLTLIFSSDSATANLTGILNSGENSSEENSVFSQSLTYAYGGMDSEESSISLVKSAMRSREREKSEEKWVFYSEVVEGKQKKVEEEVTSGFAENSTTNTTTTTLLSCSLSLKLDYDEILNAWSDKGSLYIGGLGEGSQIVPELNDHQLFDLDSALMDGLWSVPEKSITMAMEEESNGVGWKIGQREASVLRYKEKRQNRLFAKRIRYQVRKLNAEKRPRMKGRFVKRG